MPKKTRYGVHPNRPHISDDRHWWRGLRFVRDNQLWLPAFLDLAEGRIRLRPDVADALEGRFAGKWALENNGAERQVLRQAARLIMPRLTAEGWRTDPLARTLDLLMADASSAHMGLKSGSVTRGNLLDWAPELPVPQAAAVYLRHERELLGTRTVEEMANDLMTCWAFRWHRAGVHYPEPLSGRDYVQAFLYILASWREPAEYAGHCALIPKLLDGVRQGCPVGQTSQAFMQPLLTALGPEPSLGRIANCYRRLLEWPDTSALDVETFWRAVPMTAQVRAVLTTLDWAYHRPPPPIWPGLPPGQVPVDLADFAVFRATPLGVEVEAEFEDSRVVDDAMRQVLAGGADQAIATLNAMLPRAPAEYPLGVQLKQGTLLRFWEEGDSVYRFAATGLRADDVTTVLWIASVWPRAWFVLALAYVERKCFDHAEYALQRAAQLDDDPRITIERATIAHMCGRLAQSRQLLEGLLERQARMVPALEGSVRRGLAVRMIDDDDYRGALDMLRQAEAADPDHPATAREMEYLIVRIMTQGEFKVGHAKSLMATNPACAVCGVPARKGAAMRIVGNESIPVCPDCLRRWAPASD